MSELATSAPAWESKVDLIKKTVAANTTNDELELFLYQAKRAGLDPLSRQIHCVVRGQGQNQGYHSNGYRRLSAYRRPHRTLCGLG